MKIDMKEAIRRYYQAWFGMNELYAQWARLHGLTVNTLLALYVIRNTENCSQQDICRLLLLPKQTVNSILNNLEKSGYVSRLAGIADKRNKVIAFSPEGRRYAEKVLAELYQAEAGALGMMAPAQIEGLIEGSETYLRNFREKTNQRE